MAQRQDIGTSAQPASKRENTGNGGHRKPTGRTASASAAERAAKQAISAAGSLSALAGEEVKRVADRQVAVGADIIQNVADAIRTAADNLDESVPQLGGLARGAADRIGDFSETIREQSITDLARTASDFARRRPAILLGAAAAAGFILYRILGAASSGYTPESDEMDAFDDEAGNLDFGEDTSGQTTGGTNFGGSDSFGGSFNGA